MILLTASVLLAFAPQIVPQVQRREIIENNVHIEYPEIANAPVFNAAVHRILNPVVETFRDGTPKPNDSEPNGYVNGRYTAGTLKTGIVSVLLEWTVYVPGAAAH